MNLLIAHGRLSDMYLVKAAQEEGHIVHFMCNLQKGKRLDEVKEKCNPDMWVPLESRYDLQVSHQSYSNWYHDVIHNYVVKHEIHAILPSSSIDVVMNEIAKVNETFDLPGIRPEHAAFFCDKTVYLPALSKAGIRVPEIYEIVEPGDEPKNYDLPYPVIAKPGFGCGGYGIYIAETQDKMGWFFRPTDNIDGFSKRALFYQDRGFDGEPKSYLHFGFGGRYLIQKYLEGPCISLAGTTRDGVPQLNLAYDIGISSPPTCAEINFSWPSAHHRVQDAAERLSRSLGEVAGFPNGGWMADAILHEGELWLIDLSCRMSSSGTKMLYHTVMDELAYPASVIHAILGKEPIYMVPEYPTYYSFLPFPKGKLTNIKYPVIRDEWNTRLTDTFLPMKGEGMVFEMRNDIQVSERGWVVAESNGTREDAQTLVEKFINGIEFDVE